MSEYTRVTIEADDRGRLSINADDERGVGHGYRIAGPEFCGCCPGRTTAKRVLTPRDVEEIRSYLAIWDEIHAKSGEVTR
jgi:hypothetical protein